MLAGRRVTLRPLSAGDKALVTGWFSDPQIFKDWGGAPLGADVIARKYFGRRKARLESFVVEREGVPIGYIQASHERNGTAHVDIALVPKERERGFGSDAIRTLVRRLRSQIRVGAITADPAPQNVAALRAFKKAGFVRRASRLAIPGTGV